MFVFYFPAAAVAKARKEYRRISERRLIFVVSQTNEMLGRERGGVDPLLKHKTEKRTFRDI